MFHLWDVEILKRGTQVVQHYVKVLHAHAQGIHQSLVRHGHVTAVIFVGAAQCKSEEDCLQKTDMDLCTFCISFLFSLTEEACTNCSHSKSSRSWKILFVLGGDQKCPPDGRAASSYLFRRKNN
jgi:hypothetical protein